MREYPKDYRWSSAAYVAALPLVRELIGDDRIQKLPLRRWSSQCDHKSTICTECWYMWAQDYELLLNNSVGGRWLDDNKMQTP